MATIYSPELVSSLQDYLTALTTYREMRQGPFSDLANGSRAMLQASRQRLRLWGLSDAQIDRVARSGKPSLELPLLAPASGVVTKKMVVAGQYVKTGDVLYDVADLSTVWVEANVFEAQLSAVKVGQRVAVTTAAYPGKTFPGRVAFIYPFLSPETRSVKVRAELPNPAGLLKPDMFVSVQIHQAPGRSNALAVPASAVIDAGRRKIVFVEVSPGVFRPREVSLGAPAGEYYPVLSGLAAGDKVATSGGFLLDANSQIQAGGGDTAGMDMPSQGGPQGATGTSGAMGEMPGMAMPRNGAGGK
jgi:Cu(I)/Ag(I) efflux system membrane fusion protein